MAWTAHSAAMALSLASALLLGAPFVVCAAPAPPSVPGVDAPVLAPLGPAAVGLRTITLADADRSDPLAYDAAKAAAPRGVRQLTLDLWYPARRARGAAPVHYVGALPGERPGSEAHYDTPGLAVRNAIPMGGRHPLIILSHGYSNEPGMMSWLAENLASKGYVVAGVHHRDPAITNPKGFSGPLMNRPLDIAFTARELRRKAARAGNRIGDLIDPNRVAAIGYSMGGYGVLTAAGAGLSPKGAAGLTVPGGLMTPFLRGGSRAADMRIDGLKAVVAISPAGGGVMNAWGEEGLADIKAPLLIIAGDLDRTVGYADGPAAIFDHATGAHRYKLVFRNAGHSIGVNPAAEGMRHALWDVDWFEDPIWRKDRVIGVNLHFITAFLDRYVKGDEAMAGYLDGLTPLSDDGVWPASSGASWGEVSPGGAITLWKGFPRRHALGLELRRADPAAR